MQQDVRYIRETVEGTAELSQGIWNETRAISRQTLETADELSEANRRQTASEPDQTGDQQLPTAIPRTEVTRTV